MLRHVGDRIGPAKPQHQRRNRQFAVVVAAIAVDKQRQAFSLLLGKWSAGHGWSVFPSGADNPQSIAIGLGFHLHHDAARQILSDRV